VDWGSSILVRMPIVARADRRRPGSLASFRIGLGLAAVLVASCGPTAPSGSGAARSIAPSPGVSASAVVGGPPPACPVGIPPVAPVPWWQSAVFYEVFVRSFADSNGDGIGDLDGLTAHLDHLNDGNAATSDDLGVTALWLMPVATSPSYHGYDVTDYTAVEPDYGNAAAFQRLIAAAHARGIKVVVDFEANHTSSEHPWFKDALAGGPHRDWYIWSKDDPGWPNPIGAGDPWRSSAAGFYYALFWEGMPDLNLRNPAVTDALDGAARFWLDAMGVDGFRIDAARHLIEDGPAAQVNTPETRAWLAAFRDVVHEDRGDAITIGEVNDAERTSGSYTTDGSLDMSFDFEIGPAIANAVSHGDAGSLLLSETGVGKAYPNGGAATFLSNHDQTRIMTQVHGDAGVAAQSAATLLTGPGTPFIYYGEEVGMTGDKPDEHIRTPFAWTAAGPGYGFTTGTPWEPFGDDPAAANLATEASDPASLFSTTGISSTSATTIRRWRRAPWYPSMPRSRTSRRRSGSAAATASW
jgi:alpha-amylase